MNLQELNELELDNIGAWPMVAKMVLVLIMCALLAVGCYFFFIKDSVQHLKQEQAKELELKRQFEAKALIAAGLAGRQQQMETMTAMFDELLKQLPNKSEVARMLDDLSFIGMDNGLVFRKIHWEPQQQTEFSIEVPIRIEVTGTYHQLGEFVSDVAALPRIVTLEDFAIQKQEGDLLNVSLLARTYQYRVEEQ